LECTSAGIFFGGDFVHVLAVDVSKDTLQYFSPSISGRVDNTPEGVQKLFDLSKHIEGLILVCESTGVYSQYLMNFFNSNRIPAYYIPSDAFSNARKLLKRPKTDRQDARTIFDAAMVIPTRLIPFQTFDELIEQLRDLMRYRFAISHDTARLKVRLNALVAKYFPGLDFDFRATYTYFLRNYSIEEIVEMDYEEMVQIVSKISHSRIDPQQFVQKLKESSRGAMNLSPSPRNALKLTINLTIDNIQSHLKQIKIIDAEVDKIVKKIPQTLTSLPGIGSTTAAGIISEIGKIERFSSPAKLASYAGITWNSYESGKYKSEDNRMTKKGNKYLRYYIVHAARTVARFEPVFKSYYDKKYNESFNHNAGRAIVLSARKLVNVIYFMMINQKQYDPREIR